MTDGSSTGLQRKIKKQNMKIISAKLMDIDLSEEDVVYDNRTPTIRK